MSICFLYYQSINRNNVTEYKTFRVLALPYIFFMNLGQFTFGPQVHLWKEIETYQGIYLIQIHME